MNTKRTLNLLAIAFCGFLAPSAIAVPPDDGSVLPFPSALSASKAGPTLQESIHKRRVEPDRLPKGAPNVLIVLIDDAGFGVPDTFGGFAHTPTLSKLCKEGISYNRFHTTSICSPTRAALLTGRNHQRVGNGTNGSSAEGQNGSISELLAQNQIPNTIAQQIKALDGLGGLKALGGPLTDNIYHASWAWAGSTPFRSTKLVAAHFGGTRNPLVVSWPKQIKADKKPRSQFYHVNDIVPTLYDVIGIKAPEEVNGFPQDPIDGVSMAASFSDPTAAENKHVQYFDNNGSDGIYKDGWYACTFGPLSPWLNAQPGLDKWDSSKAVWELYDLTRDFSQMHDLAKEHPEKVEELKKLFLAQAEENNVFPIGAGIWLRIHPEDRIKSPYTSWTFDDTTTRMPEFTAPALGNHNNTVTIDLECGKEASGVLYAMGGSGGGLTCYMDKGHLIFEYNLMIIDRSIAKSMEKIAAGRHTIIVNTTLKAPKPGSPADIVLSVDGKEFARTTAKMTVPAAFTASESFDVGTDLGSTVSRDYYDHRPFKYNGKIEKLTVELK